jgi:hypothetical protein
MARWIKVESSTPDKPELRQIAKLCGVSRPEAFTAFFRFFCWADENTEDGFLRFFDLADADEESHLAGFGAALSSVGWAVFTTEGMQIVNWDLHNGNSAKKRCLTAERVNRSRKRNAQSVTDVTLRALPDKRR